MIPILNDILTKLAFNCITMSPISNFLILAIILSIPVKATITDDDKAIISGKLSALSQLLMNDYNYLQSNIKLISNYNYCPFTDTCKENSTSWPGASYPPTGLSPDIGFGNRSVGFNDTAVKFLYGTPPSQSIINEVCYVNSQKTIWSLNLQLSRSGTNANLTGVMWQYYGGESAVSIFYPTFKWSDTDTCPNSQNMDYNPKNRPWYVSAVSAKKNLILIIDLSDTLHDSTGVRLARMKQSALLLVNGLSYRDFVGVIVYTEYASSYRPVMMRATIDNINALNLYINSLQVVPSSVANIGDALQDAYQMLGNSINNDVTSMCNNIFFVLSSGANDIITIKPINAVKNSVYQNVTIFSNVYASDTAHGGVLDLAEVSCYTKGNLLTVGSDNDATEIVSKFNEYMATATYNTFIRWSEPYDDALTNTRLITASLPIYTNNNASGLRIVYGVVAIDVDINTLLNNNPNLTETDIMNYLINTQTCPTLEITSDFLKQIQSEETCKQNEANSQDKTNAEKYKGAYVFASTMTVLFLILFPFTIMIKNKYDSKSYDEDSLFIFACVVAIVMFVGGIWASCVFWINLFPQVVKHENWIPTEFTTERIVNNSYRCCDVVNCRSCEEYSAKSCDSLLGSLQEGPCGNGYHCCRKNCYTCSCHSSCSNNGKSCSTYCSTCCYCAESVNHRRCDVVCGTCWNPIATMSFTDKEGELTYGYTSTHCGLNDTSCVNSFSKKNGPIGKETSGYYNPYNKNEITTSISYDKGIMAAVLVPTSIMALFFLFCLIILFMKWCIPFGTICYNGIRNPPRIGATATVTVGDFSTQMAYTK
jgi:hypothetical protein